VRRGRRRDGALQEVPTTVLELLPDFLLHPNPEIYLSDNFVVFDLECNTKGDGASPMPCWSSNSLVCGSWVTGSEQEARNIYGNELQMGTLAQCLEDADFVVAFNGKFDIGWMLRAGIDPYKLVLYDPMIAEYCIVGNKKKNLSLDNLAKEYIGEGKRAFIDICMKKGIDPEDMPKSKLIERCDMDVLQTRDLFLAQREKIIRCGLLGHVYTRSLLSTPLADIESKGMHIDAGRVKGLYLDSASKLANATQAVDEFTGGINPRSPKQVKEFVYEELKFKPKMKGKGRNATPILSTRTEDLLQLKATNKRQREFIELKQDFARHNADVGKNLMFFNGVATDRRTDVPADIFYAKFNQCVTVTHRLSSSGIPRTFEHIQDDKGEPVTKSVQFQNFPRKYKPIFCPRNKGWLMGESDGAQLEFRVAAFLGQCLVATQDIVNNTDVHNQTSTVLTENGQETSRQDAKAHTFKPLYGGQSGTKAEVAYYDWFKEHYKGVGDTQQAWIDQALKTKKVRLIHGFTFFFPECKLSASGYVTGTTNICNYPVQHFATAEIIPIAVTYMWHLMKEMKSFLVNTIHDSAIAEVHPDEVDTFREYSKYSFTYLVYHYLKEVYDVEFNVPLGIGCKLGEHWGEGTELKCVPLPPYDMEGIDYSELITDWVED
jgi:DNA polymerase I-like protein with 3'-5' exonuclease and polymerase domains